jgi:magnesium transporter
MKLRLLSPRDLARTLRAMATRNPDEVEEYLDRHTEEWSALAESMPGEAADILEALSEEAAGELIGGLDVEEAVEILEELRPRLAAGVLEELAPGAAAGLLSEMEPEEAADILVEIDDEEAVASLLELMEEEASAATRRLLAYAPDSAGGLMTTEVATLPVGLTAGEAIERIRSLHEELEDLFYVYVVDAGERLLGVLSFRDLVFVRPGVGLDEAMVTDPVTVRPETDREEVAELIQRYHLFGLPVVDDGGRLLGMVTQESVIEAVQEEAVEDFVAAVGAGAEETVHTGIRRSVRMRLPWLLVNLVLALVVALVIEQQTGVISREPVLAAFMPVVALLGGSGGSQSLAVVIRSLATGDLPASRTWEVIGRQTVVGVLEGAVLSVAAAALAHSLLRAGVFASNSPPVEVAVVVGVGVLASLSVATLVGTAIPLVLRRLGADPALASSIFLTLITDVVGFGGFLLVGATFL